MSRRSSLIAFGFVIAALLMPCFPLRAQDANEAKARALVDSAIQMTDSDQAVKLLWQATEIDPRLTDSYLYLGLYYNSRENFPKVIEVYRKLLKYRPKEVSAYLNIGEAYMSFNPPRYDDALGYFRKAYSIDPTSALAALRIGEILAHEGQREDAIRFLSQAASGAKSKDPSIAAEAQKVLGEIASH
jgi:tetratricopeptide (TPR) repeat protein